MTNHAGQLEQLLISLPSENNYRSVSEINSIITQYLKILDYVNGYNPEYKSITRVYYSDITNIRDHIQISLVGNSEPEKEYALECAKKELKNDLSALALLINQKSTVKDLSY